MQKLCKDLEKCNLLLRIDNCTELAYINRMGGVRFIKYNDLAKSIWQWAEKRKVFLKAAYIPSKMNKDADRLSRMLNPDTEWELSQEAFSLITDNLGTPEIDIFASEKNAKCKDYFSWLPDPGALQIDAFTVSWNNMFFYAFPPFSLILPTLQKIKNEGAKGILVVPKWINQPWYPMFLEMAIGEIMIFGPNPNLLISLCRDKQHPAASHLQLVAATVLGKHL